MFLTLKDTAGAAARGVRPWGAPCSSCRGAACEVRVGEQQITLFPRWEPQLARANCCSIELLLLSRVQPWPGRGLLLLSALAASQGRADKHGLASPLRNQGWALQKIKPRELLVSGHLGVQLLNNTRMGTGRRRLGGESGINHQQSERPKVLGLAPAAVLAHTGG